MLIRENKQKINWKNLYTIWADKYDSWPNVINILEERALPEILGNVNGKDILDLGCGTGRWSIKLAEQGANLYSVDKHEKMLKVFRNKARGKNLKIKIVKKDMEKLSVKKKFDIVLLGFVIDNIRDIDKIFKVAVKHLKDNGLFLISQPVYDAEESQAEKEINILEGKYRIKLHLHSLKEIQAVALKCGLQVVEVKRLFADKTVKHIYDKKPHKSYSDYRGKHLVTIYKLQLLKT